MSNFDSAISFVLQNEGGYIDHKNDKGGATNFGISTRFLKLAKQDLNGDGHVNYEDVKGMCEDRAIALYKTFFWDQYGLDKIRDVAIATKALDLFVNMRGSNAAKILQRACNEMGSELVVDGVFGRRSFYQLNDLSTFTDKKELLLTVIRGEQAKFYRAIVKSDKTQKVFLNGWLNRAKR